ncbi:5606_t:CDS:1, partial [Acaulospora colombiana]
KEDERRGAERAEGLKTMEALLAVRSKKLVRLARGVGEIGDE